MSYAEVFAELRAIMHPVGRQLVVARDSEFEYYVNTRFIQKNKTPLFFGAVQIKKSFVSYHLMPVYVRPALLAGISSGLSARMQGKSCFNFRSVDKELFRELADLTKAGFRTYQELGFI